MLDIVEEAGYEVRSVHFEAAGSSRVAYIRLENSEAAEQKYDPASQACPDPARPQSSAYACKGHVQRWGCHQATGSPRTSAWDHPLKQ